MLKKKFYTTAGFTLLELLIVFGIIALIISIFVASTAQSRINTRNAAVLSQIGEYEKALNLYYADNGAFPGSASVAARKTERCLGEGPNNNGCWTGAGSADSYLTAALVPGYMSELPGFDQGNLGSPAYNGCTGTYFNDNANANCTTDDFSLFFLLEGINQDCARYHQSDPNYRASDGDYTLCRMNLSAE